MNIRKRQELLRKLGLPFCIGSIWKFLGSIRHFSPADLEQLEYGIRLIREQEQAEKQYKASIAYMENS